MKKVIIGSRGSDLALWQAHYTQKELKALGFDSEIKIIVTKGDKIQNLSFDKLEGKGFFTKEIEEALLNKEIDVAVHSHKDLETDQPEGLIISAVSYRENPADVLLINKNVVDQSQKFGLKTNAIVGTSSARRKNQMQFFRPDVELKDLRGNVPTRVNKLRDENYDAIILAHAGINRLELNLSDFEVVELSPKEFVPAAAQGVLAFQTRVNDTETNAIITKLNDAKVAECIQVERTILNQLEGGCQLPLGAYCERSEEGVKLWVSQAEKWEDTPNRLYREATSTEGLATEILEELKKKVS